MDALVLIDLEFVVAEVAPLGVQLGLFGVEAQFHFLEMVADLCRQDVHVDRFEQVVLADAAGVFGGVHLDERFAAGLAHKINIDFIGGFFAVGHGVDDVAVAHREVAGDEQTGLGGILCFGMFNAVRQDGCVGRLADREDQRLAGNFELAAFDGGKGRLAGIVRFAEPVVHEGDRLQLAVFGLAADRGDVGLDGDVLAFHFGEFFFGRSHLRLAAAVHDRHVCLRGESAGRAGTVDRGKPAADDDDVVAFDREGPAVVIAFHEIEALDAHTLGQLVQLERSRVVGARGDEDGIELALHVGDFVTVDRVVIDDIHAGVEDGLYVFVEDVVRQTELGHAHADLSAGIGLFFVDGHVMAVAFELSGGGQTGGTGADDGNGFAGCFEIGVQRLALSGFHVRGGPLQ